jgi:hypothetical protein
MVSIAKRSFRLVLFGLIICISAQGQLLPTSNIKRTSIYMLNDKPIEMIRYQYGEPHIYFLALHDTEKTGLKAAFKFMGTYGGVAVELKYGLVRNISFLDSLKEFSFDPNTMFTDGGAFLGLARNSRPRIAEGLPGKVRELGDEVLKFINVDTIGVIITLHNNYDGGFSIFSYMKGNYLENTAAQVFINPAMDADNFVFVTERRFFNYLKQKQVNVVLQSIGAPDDGSLSVYAMQGSIPYVNIEAQHGNLEENYRMILVVDGMLKEIWPTGTHALTKNR